MQIYNNTFDHNLRGIEVIDGTRSEIVSNVMIRNNLISGTLPASNNLLNVNDVSHHRSAEQMGVSVNYDAYSRERVDVPEVPRDVVRLPRRGPRVHLGRRLRGQGPPGAQRFGARRHIDGVVRRTRPGNDYRIAPGNGVLGRSVGLPASMAAPLGVPGRHGPRPRRSVRHTRTPT